MLVQIFYFQCKKPFKKIKNYFLNIKYIDSITGGRRVLFNFEIQNNLPIQWLDYKYQALWV